MTIVDKEQSKLFAAAVFHLACFACFAFCLEASILSVLLQCLLTSYSIYSRLLQSLFRTRTHISRFSELNYTMPTPSAKIGFILSTLGLETVAVTKCNYPGFTEERWISTFSPCHLLK